MPPNSFPSNGFRIEEAGKYYEPPEDADNAEIRLKNVISNKYKVQFDTYEDWFTWTHQNYPQFWETVLEECDVKLHNKYTKVVEADVPMPKVPKWFPGATLNYAENCLKNGKNDKIAFIEYEINGNQKTYTYSVLRQDVAALATALRDKFNVQKGDHICGYLPNVYETAVAMLATTALGGTWSSCSTDFGPTGVLDRFAQINPKVLFVVDKTSYKGKHHSLVNNVNEIVDGLGDDLKVIVIPQLDKPIELDVFDQRSQYFCYNELKKEVGDTAAIEYTPVPFHHPLFVMFSSGTTGIPKGIVHTVGGVLLKHVEEHIIQTNISEQDTILFYTTCGWMMWNWLMTVLFTGATIVLYNESPLEPQDILLKIVSETKATVLGMGAKIYDEYAKSDIDYKKIHSLSQLRLILSTASPLKASTFAYLNGKIRPQVVIGSISGGTDIVGCFMGATLNRPVVPGECQHFYLGLDMCTFNENGEQVEDERAELVCRNPFPSMPLEFINDSDGRRYFNAYFNKFPGVWTHGDFVLIDSQTKGSVIFGRSDTTLNRGGVRIGTAEIYAVVEKFEEIADSLVIGTVDPQDDTNENVLLFVKLAPGHKLTLELMKNIKIKLRNRMSPRHVPNEVHPIDDIPYTNSGKKVELAVKQVLQKEVVKNINSLRNPESLKLFEPFAST
ncbi:unnamed protein product [Bursaphelenchus xylophilus]|uniref:Acetoacetyl-CoA synthetase n=1 Tax=Bursaphelenchus xylophilus TaxID=6326 RepID=A0A1I7S060_BURXY|nr:unnamed protein product [Bursaphelenchus xylophilus]CAG9108994.1 unnamed protein product [Bursaphelenchus xylophilus]